MLNYYELMKLIKGSLDVNQMQTIRESFNADFIKEYNKIHFNKTSRKNALDSFIKNNERIFADKEHSYLWATQTSVIYSNSFDLSDDDTNGLETDVFKIIESWIKGKNQKPTDFHFRESVAVARALGWTQNAAKEGNKAYHVLIDDNYYDFSLVYGLCMLFADKDIKSGGVNVYTVKMEGTQRRALVVKSRYGMGFLLPVNSVLNPCYNVCFNNYMEHEKSLDDIIMKDVSVA